MRVAILLYNAVDEYAAAGLRAAFATPSALRLTSETWRVEGVGVEAMHRGAYGSRLVPDVLGYAHARDADVLLVPGGPGARELARNPEATRVLREHHREGRWTGAVGEGVVFLGRVGLLAERRVAVERALRDEAAPLVEDVAVGSRVVEDGRVVTAAGAAAGVELALQVVSRVLTLDSALRTAEHLGVKGWAPMAGEARS